jgi:hypothetical protein
MIAPNPNRRTRDTLDVDAGPQGGPVMDVSGCAIFAAGDTGGAHAMAHRMLDTGRARTGHRQLGEWLATRTGAGSEWTHLHFHMAIFELAVDDWGGAHARFLAHVLPAVETGEALTDAPGLLWRLAITAPVPVALPWQPLRRAALARMGRTRDPFIQMHNLLALAGAGDARGIERWLRTPTIPRPDRAPAVKRMARALKWLAAGSFQEAGVEMEKALSDTASVGGSHAQNQLFRQLAQWCAGPAADVGGALYANAA